MPTFYAFSPWPTPTHALQLYNALQPAQRKSRTSQGNQCEVRPTDANRLSIDSLPENGSPKLVDLRSGLIGPWDRRGHAGGDVELPLWPKPITITDTHLAQRRCNLRSAAPTVLDRRRAGERGNRWQGPRGLPRM